MAPRRHGIQILGWLSIVAGSSLALLQIRKIFIGLTRGFGASRSQAFWIIIGCLLCLALAVYLFAVGRRALLIAKGSPRPRARFGWGRILVGGTLLYASVVDHFHLIPAYGFKHLEPTNQGEAVGMQVAAIVFTSGCVLLIFAGFWSGFKPHRTSPPKN